MSRAGWCRLTPGVIGVLPPAAGDAGGRQRGRARPSRYLDPNAAALSEAREPRSHRSSSRRLELRRPGKNQQGQEDDDFQVSARKNTPAGAAYHRLRGVCRLFMDGLPRDLDTAGSASGVFQIRIPRAIRRAGRDPAVTAASHVLRAYRAARSGPGQAPRPGSANSFEGGLRSPVRSAP